jgi:hypothetical protein
MSVEAVGLKMRRALARLPEDECIVDAANLVGTCG